MALSRKGWRETAEDAASSVEEQHPRVFGFDAVELLGQSSSSHFSDLPGQLDSGRSATGYGEREPCVALGSGRQRFGHLERTEQPSTDAQCIVEGLHPRRPLREFLVAEIRLPHSDGDDQHVVVDRERGLVRAAGGNPARVCVEVERLA